MGRGLRVRMRPLCGIALGLLLLMPFPLCAQAQPPAAPAAAASKAPALPIGPGDLLEIAVFDTPELSGRLRVDEKGQITLPVGGVLSVSGLTAEAAAALVEKRLRDAAIMLEPHVTVMVEEYATQGVTVAGEVKNPGTYPLLGSRTVADMISSAGGLDAGGHGDHPDRPSRRPGASAAHPVQRHEPGAEQRRHHPAR